MKFRKTLIKILLSGSLAFLGCEKYHPEYYFCGNIKGDSVHFFREENYSEDLFSNRHYLDVIKPNGIKIRFMDYYGGFFNGGDLKVDGVSRSKDEILEFYDNKTQDGKMVLKVAQIEFDDYLRKIKEKKMNFYNKGLDN